VEFLIVFGLSFFLFGLTYAILGIGRLRKIQGVNKDWSTAEGFIVDAHVSGREYADADNPNAVVMKYEPVVTYTYEVGGQAYRRTQYGVHLRDLESAASEAVCKRLPPDAKVIVNYNPENPEQALLRLQTSKMKYYPVLGVGIGFMLLGCATAVLASSLL